MLLFKRFQPIANIGKHTLECTADYTNSGIGNESPSQQQANTLAILYTATRAWVLAWCVSMPRYLATYLKHVDLGNDDLRLGQDRESLVASEKTPLS